MGAAHEGEDLTDGTGTTANASDSLTQDFHDPVAAVKSSHPMAGVDRASKAKISEQGKALVRVIGCRVAPTFVPSIWSKNRKRLRIVTLLSRRHGTT